MNTRYIRSRYARELARHPVHETHRRKRDWPLFAFALLPLAAIASPTHAAPALGAAPGALPGGFASMPGLQGLAANLKAPGAVPGLVSPAGSQLQSTPAIVSASAAAVLPTGGVVKAGQAQIGTPSGSSLIINQSSSKAVIDWSSFSIGHDGQVRFDNGTGATLNRVTGQSLSSIDGLLSASGSVYLLNPNGVIIGKDGVVNVGGSFIASTLNLTDQSFLSGGALTFTGSSTQSVINLGKIGSLGGDVALIATTVRNDGAITAPQGDVGLLAGSSVLMRDQASDGGKFAVLVGGNGTSVTNSGTIEAAEAELRAEGGNVYALAGNTAGVIKAQGVSTTDGRIFLTSGAAGTTEVAGTLDAQGANGAGGFIETSGGTLTLGAAKVDGHGGTWLIDPNNLEITSTAASAISTALATTDVSEVTDASSATTSGAGEIVSLGAGDVTLDAGAAITWSSGHSLTLNAWHDLDILGTISATGTGAGTSGNVTLFYGQSGSGSLKFGPAGYIRFADATHSSLDINETFYTLVPDLSTLAADIASATPGLGNSGHYALANNYDASGAGPYTASPLPATINTAFAGTFEGLGNTISNVSITDASNANVGLFGQIASSGVVRDLVLNNVSATGGGSSGLLYVGGLAGHNLGTVQNVAMNAVTVSGQIGTSGTASVGGLIGRNDGVISNASAANVTATLTSALTSGSAQVGGLVGLNVGSMTTASAGSVNVSSPSSGLVYVGGLVGYNGSDLIGGTSDGSVTVATGPVSGSRHPFAGGLAGYNSAAGSISSSSSSATVTGGDHTDIGGLVSANLGTISGSSASGTVSGGANGYAGGLAGFNAGSVSGSFAVGGVSAGSGAEAGGLLGYNGGSVSGSFATGAVTGTDSSAVAGLVGYNDAASSVVQSYATGAVSGGQLAGGLVGYSAGVIDNAWAGGAVTGDVATQALNGVGGLVGWNGGTVTNAYAIGAVTSQGAQTGFSSFTGGLIGFNGGSASLAWASGAVTAPSGTNSVGGLIGENNGPATKMYWDSDTTAQLSAIGVNTVPGETSALIAVKANDGTAFTQSSYGNFDFGATWYMIDGETRPFLRSEASSTIYNDHQLELMGLNLSGSYTVGGDIGFTLTSRAGLWRTSADPDGAGGYGFVPVGSMATPFTGSLNGQNHLLRGLAINRPTMDDVGLFGAIGAGGSVSNLGLVGAVVGRNDTALLAGYNNGALANIVATGSVSGATSVGGLVGFNDTGGAITAGFTGDVLPDPVFGVNDVGGLVGTNLGAIAGSGAAVTVTGADQVGGLVGQNFATVTGSVAAGNVTGANNVGGLVGWNGATAAGGAYPLALASINNSYAIGRVTASGQSAGGLVGYNAGSAQGGGAPNSLVSASYATGNVTGGDATGGLVGKNFGVINNSHANGNVVGADYVGGLVGKNFNVVTDIAAQTFATGSVTGGNYVGGLVGYNGASLPGTGDSSTAAASITDAYATGNVTGTGQSVGGLVGFNAGANQGGGVPDSTVSGTYATGAVTGGNATGGLVGKNFGAVEDSYALGPVTGANYVGGLVGKNFGAVGGASTPLGNKTISSGSFNVYAVGAVTGANYVGGLVGYNGATISGTGIYPGVAASILNAGAGGAVTGSGQSVGGLVGYNAGVAQGGGSPDSTISGSIAVGGVTGGNATGGLVGKNFGVVEFSTANGAVTGANYVGGLVGKNFESITDSTANGSVSGASYVGGLVGWNGATTPATGIYPNATGAIANSTAHGWVFGSGQSVGGLVGYNAGVAQGGGSPDSTITNSSAYGLVSGANILGGLVGQNFGQISLSFAQGAVERAAPSGGNDYGGLVGKNFGTITTANAYGLVSGASYVGGLVGWNGASSPTSAGALISGTYAYGKVFGSGQNVGGLVGYNAGSTLGDGSPESAIQNSRAYGPSVAGGNATGGLVGTNFGTVYNSFAYADVSGSDFVGGLVGQNFNSVSLSGVSRTASVEGHNYVGGLVGWNGAASPTANGADIYVSYSYAPVDGTGRSVGGLVGYNGGSAEGGGMPDSVIIGSHAYGSVNGGNATGGLVGHNFGQIDVSWATGAVTGQNYVGGLVGKNFNTVSGSYATGSVGGRDYVGGLVGWNGATTGSTGIYPNAIGVIRDSYATGSVTGEDAVGGLVGWNSGAAQGGGAPESTIDTSYASGGVTLSASGGRAGGLVGYNGGTIRDAYASGAVSAGGKIGFSPGVAAFTLGGLVGENAGTVTNAYATGALTGNQAGSGTALVGGLVGLNDTGSSIGNAYATGAIHWAGTVTVGGVAASNGGAFSNIYWDTATTGLPGAVGSGSAAGASPIGGSNPTPYGSGSYFGFDFTPGTGHWIILQGETRPFLAFEQPQNLSAIANGHELQLLALNPTGTYWQNADFTIDDTNPSSMWRTGATPDSNGGYGFVPIGTAGTPFSGAFYGNGYSIQSLAIARPNSDEVGLFGNLSGYVGGVELVGGQVTGANNVGELAGFSTGTIFRSSATTMVVDNFPFPPTTVGNVGGSGVNIGGLVGSNLGSIDQSFATLPVSGGLSGAGGLAGYNGSGASLTNSYALGAVSGTDSVGGLVGKNFGTITAVYSTGTVSGSTAVGGLIGTNGIGGSVASAYWNTDLSGLLTGIGTSTGTGAAAGLLDVQSKVLSNFAGFTFLWSQSAVTNSGYPYLTFNPPGL